MKRQLAAGFFGALIALSIGAVVMQTTGIYILNPTDEVQLKVRKSGANQANPWIEIVDGDGTVRLTLPATGILPVAYGGSGASTAKGARTALGLPEGSTNASMPLISSTTAKEGRTALGLPEGTTNSAMPLISSTTAKEGRTALGLPESTTNALGTTVSIKVLIQGSTTNLLQFSGGLLTNVTTGYHD
jgi:hypothetical protein